MASTIFGQPAPTWGSRIAGIHVASHAQARLLAEILQRELRDRAGLPEETLLAKWHNEVTRIREKAVRECWRGWEER